MISEQMPARRLWACWGDIPSNHVYGRVKTDEGLTIPRHLALRQFPRLDVSAYEVQSDASEIGLYDGKARWNSPPSRQADLELMAEKNSLTIHQVMNKLSLVESRTDKPESRTCPCGTLLSKPASGRTPTFCSNKCRMKATRDS